MATSPGPRPAGSPGDCVALAALLGSYADVLEDEVRRAGRIYSVVSSGRWTGRAAEFAQNAINNWQDITLSSAADLTDLAGRLRSAAGDLEVDLAAWRGRADVYAEAVRETERWGPR